jgi:hypothetical protein
VGNRYETAPRVRSTTNRLCAHYPFYTRSAWEATFKQQAQQQQQSFQQMTQEVMSTYSELFNIPISYAKEGIRDARFPIEDYDELTVEEVSAPGGALGRRLT